MNRIDLSIKDAMAKIWPICILAILFFLVILPISLFRKVYGLQKISQTRCVGNGWHPVSHDTCDTKCFHVVTVTNTSENNSLSSRGMFGELKRKAKIPWIFGLYHIMCRLPHERDEQESALPTDHYAMF